MFGLLLLVALWVFYASGGLPKLIGTLFFLPFKIWEFFEEKISRK